MKNLITKRINEDYYLSNLTSKKYGRGYELSEIQKKNIIRAIKKGCEYIENKIIQESKKEFGLEVFVSENLLDADLFGRFSTAFFYINNKLYEICSDILNEINSGKYHITTPNNWLMRNAEVYYKN